jgi:hypothetical protein
MVNKQGDVVKVRTLESTIHDKIAVNMFKKHMYTTEFKPAKTEDPKFREFIFPYQVKQSVKY